MRIIGNFFASIISFVYFFVLMAMSFLLILSNLFSADYFSDILKSIEFSEIKLSDLGIQGLEEGVTLEDLLVDTLEEAGVSADDAKSILNSDEIKDVAGSFITDTVSYVTGKDSEIPQIKEKDLNKILESEELEGVLQDIPDDIQVQEMADELNKLIKDLFEGGEINVF